ncbi:MAG: DUF4286 family protein [Ginsengibacter sp.]
MFVYNLTVKVNNTILHNWIQWLKGEHIPEVMATNLFVETKFLKLLEPDDSEAATFTLQCFTDSREKYNKYIAIYSNILTEKALQKWGDNFISFGTFMQTVH